MYKIVSRKKCKRKYQIWWENEHFLLTYDIFWAFSTLDFDECHNSLCQNNGTCVNTHGDYRCECKQGYSGKDCHLGNCTATIFDRIICQDNRQNISTYYTVLYHVIENTANQNTGKPLYTRRYYTQPSHRALRGSRINYAGNCIFHGVV